MSYCCANCGAQPLPSHRFCTKCGAPIERSPSVLPQQASQAATLAHPQGLKGTGSDASERHTTPTTALSTDPTGATSDSTKIDESESALTKIRESFLAHFLEGSRPLPNCNAVGLGQANPSIWIGHAGSMGDEHLREFELALVDARRIRDEDPRVAREIEYWIDAIGIVLEERRPGWVQEVLGETKLLYFSFEDGRIRKPKTVSAQDSADFFHVFFSYPQIVAKANLFSEDKDDVGERSLICVLHSGVGQVRLVRLLLDGTVAPYSKNPSEEDAARLFAEGWSLHDLTDATDEVGQRKAFGLMKQAVQARLSGSAGVFARLMVTSHATFDVSNEARQRIVERGLESVQEAAWVIAEFETALAADKQSDGRVLNGLRAVHLLDPPPILWMCQSRFLAKQRGDLDSAAYLEERMALLDHLSETYLPRVCLELGLRYESAGVYEKARTWLSRAIGAETMSNADAEAKGLAKNRLDVLQQRMPKTEWEPGRSPVAASLPTENLGSPGALADMRARVARSTADLSAGARSETSKHAQNLWQQYGDQIVTNALEFARQAAELGKPCIADDARFKATVNDPLWRMLPFPVRLAGRKRLHWDSLLFAVRDAVFVIEGESVRLRPEARQLILDRFKPTFDRSITPADDTSDADVAAETASRSATAAPALGTVGSGDSNSDVPVTTGSPSTAGAPPEARSLGFQNNSLSKFLEHFRDGTQNLPRSAELLIDFAAYDRVPDGISAEWRDAAASLTDDALNHLWLALSEAKKLTPEYLPEPLIDLIGPLVEWHHPDKVKQLLGKTKLIYLRDLGKHDDFLLTAELKPFFNVFFRHDRRVNPAGLLTVKRDDDGAPRSLTCIFNREKYPEIVELHADGSVVEYGSTSGSAKTAKTSIIDKANQRPAGVLVGVFVVLGLSLLILTALLSRPAGRGSGVTPDLPGNVGVTRPGGNVGATSPASSGVDSGSAVTVRGTPEPVVPPAAASEIAANPSTHPIYEAETAELAGSAKINREHVGYSGSGYVDGYGFQGLGSATTFHVSVGSPGDYVVLLRYANATGRLMTVSVYVNGSKIRQTAVAPLSSWAMWSEKSEILNLHSGINTLAYRYDPGDSGNINIDSIRIEPSLGRAPTDTAVSSQLPSEPIPVESVAIPTTPPPSQDSVAPTPSSPTPQQQPPPDIAAPLQPVTLPPSAPPPYQGPLAGTLTYSGPRVVQNGEIVFRNLPPLPLRLTYDEETWEGRLTPGEGNTQRLVLKNKKPGTQNRCVVVWRVIQ